MSQFTAEWYAQQMAKRDPAFTASIPKASASDELESKTQQRINEYLDSLGTDCYYVHHRTDKATTCKVSTPDYVGCFRGVPFGIEVKRPGEKPSTEQLGELMRIRMAGGKTCVAYNVTDVVVFFLEF